MTQAPPARIPHCLDCGYRLSDLPATRCPECGREFDLADTFTTSGAGRLGAFGRWALLDEPATWIVPVTRFFVTLALVASAFFVGGRMIQLLLLSLGFFTIAAAYLPRQAIRWWFVRRHDFPRSILAIDKPLRRKSRITFAVAALLILLRVPSLLTFFVSLPWLHRTAVYEYEVRPATDVRDHGFRIIGVLPIRDTRVGLGTDEGGVHFHSPGLGMIHYRPGPRDDRRGHIFGPWYFSD